MLGVGAENLWTAGLISLAVSATLLAKRKDLLLQSFDPIQAQAIGLPVGLLHYGMLAMISLTIVATLSAVGIILSIGLLIAPGATAFLVTKQFDRMLIIAVIVTFVSGFIGIYLSFFIDSAPAPTIILVLTSFFIAAFVRATRQSRITASVDGGS
jgi:manganese/iron transport system permease protein